MTSVGILILAAAVGTAAAQAARTEIVSRKSPDVRPLSIEQLYNTRIVGGADWSPDGKHIVFTSNISGRMNLWTASAESGWPTQIAISDQRQSDPSWSPDGRWITFESDRDGDEQWDIFLVPAEGGEPRNLTKTPEVSELGATWFHHSRKLLHGVKPKSSPSYELGVLSLEDGIPRALTSGTPADRSWDSWSLSPDDSRVAASLTRADGKDSDAYVIDVATGQKTLLTKHEGEKTFSVAGWSPDGKTLLLTSNAFNGFENIALLEVASKKIDWLTKERWETSAGDFSPDGRKVVGIRNEDGNTKMLLIDLPTARVQQIGPEAGIATPAGHTSAFTRDGSRLLYRLAGPGSPGDLFTLDLATGKSVQVTNSLVGGLRAQDFVEPYLVHYDSFDGKRISAFLYVPYNLERDGKSPAIVLVHGGPTAQSVNGFNRAAQYFASNGYLVIAPNYRGSTGYGKDFQDANLMDMGGADLKDVVHAATFLETTGYVNAKSIAIYGGSYGGFMTTIALTKTPAVWAAGAAVVPFVNWFTEVENEDPSLQQYDRATMGDPVKNKALWEDRSPLFHVDAIRAPILLLAGGHDPRCPAEETRQFEKAIREKGGVVEVKIYENEGHGFARRENMIDSFERIVRFLDQHVKNRA
jgi:dipeptidyl aminopeptidase/acylaminoacyl peptidase